MSYTRTRFWCDTCAAAFRDWLRARHGDLATLNAAWGTAFWGQRYGDWAEIEPPRLAPTAVNPTQQLDYLRFCSDTHLTNYKRERDVLLDEQNLEKNRIVEVWVVLL